MAKLYELQFFLGYDFRELVGKMFKIDRFKINQWKFNNSLKFWAITTYSLYLQIWHIRCRQKVLDALSKNGKK